MYCDKRVRRCVSVCEQDNSKKLGRSIMKFKYNIVSQMNSTFDIRRVLFSLQTELNATGSSGKSVSVYLV